MTSPYVPDGDGRVWRRPGFAGLAYSDGEETERRLLQIVRAARRVDTFSPELRQAITDWPSEYHLSRARHCLLRPLGIQAGDRVLEHGCGCGALTRYLGETGARVTAVEGSLVRAGIAAERCRDLPDVRVYCENLLQFDAQERFDWIVLAGVLEYAPLFSPEPQPVEHYVRSVARFLAPEGALVVAIENQLGLKYFNGCAEDHVGFPFFGIEDLYGLRTPTTFGRKELGQRIVSCGLAALEWLYPFPDYKLPSIIVSERAFAAPDFSIADLLARVQSRDYSGHPLRLFEEPLAIAALERNGLVEDMANSFLLVARPAGVPSRTRGVIAWSYAVHRHERFATETAFVREGEKLIVRKTALSPSSAPEEQSDGSARLLQKLESAPYHRGTLLIRRVLEASARNASAEQMAHALRPWFAELLSRAWRLPDCEAGPAPEGSRLAHYWIHGALVDCTPFNIVEHEGSLSLIDQEWVWDDHIPLGHVVCRGVLHSLALPLVRTATYALADIVSRLCGTQGLAVDAEDIAGWLGLEAEFLGAVGVPLPAAPSLDNCRSHLSVAFPELVRRVQETGRLQDELHGLRAEYERRLTIAAEQMRQAASVSSSLRKALRRRTREIIALRHLRESQAAASAADSRDLSEQVVAAGPSPEVSHSAETIALSQERDVVRAMLDIARSERDAAQGSLAALEQAHQKIVASRSWRLTAPLRRFRLLAARSRA